ncbi:MAG: hypothetical protein ACFCUQ_15575 [Kiloniellales bacterium]
MTKHWLDRLLPPDDEPASPDAEAVRDAAFVLKVSEFDLFRLAYRGWHGREAEIKALERVFTAYMFHQQVPAWVRQFCRDVLAAVEQGRFDREAFGAGRVPRREPLVDYPRRFVALAMVGLLLTYLLIQYLLG